MSPRHRRCVVLRGSADATRAAALARVAALEDARVLWVGEPATRFVSVREHGVRALVGRAFDVVVLDLHAGLDADVLGLACGMIWGGGTLVLRLPPEGEIPSARDEELIVAPHTATDVAHRFWARFERVLATTTARDDEATIGVAPHEVSGDAEQRRVIDVLGAAFAGGAPALAVLLADRGRGKSSALGLAIRDAIARSPAQRVAVSAASRDATAEIFRFALGAPDAVREGAVRFVTPRALAHDGEPFDVIVVDEAAQLPVPLLQRITRAHPHARIAFSSTCRGYEGTGRGFVLRFLEWARSEPRPMVELDLVRPIRWGEDDPLERFVEHALALDAEPAAIDEIDEHALEHAVVDRARLARDEVLLGELFGLLVHAHYRTTPGDLHRMLDAPNLAVHALLHRGHVVAASVIAHEGALAPELCDRLARGRGRIRGHALPDTLISHAGFAEAGALRMVRSVRIAVHPSLRRRGLARRLVEHVHATYSPDLFGTMFGATPELLRFRRELGYELVRVGASRGSRTGEPAAVMVRPASDRGAALVASMRIELARNLPRQLALLDADGEVGLEPELERALRADLPTPPPLDEDARRAIVARYVAGPQPFDAVALAVTSYVEDHADAIRALDARMRALVESRVRSAHGWERVAADAGYPTVAAAMRALRPAIRALFDHVERS
ncbi:GNAT family N-acetyltransferase [Sandaracinus amylolyticus]|uniref:Putative P-loop ATPase n=1 Tax=Sandaracinus amylolyticus TaxID=927083 RepID=A0A0F6SDX3_9BACT|nr:GNAT family N-acetyltransferase [Sandaracinus amylolyticus]AKF04194.1 Putative P-loop ATPase [Sandaracinus amylolyticus]